MNCTERSFVSEAVSGSYIRTSCSSTQQNPEPWPCHTRSWCIFQCETETWCVVQHTQSKSCPDHHAYQKSYIGLYVLQRSQWMMILHPCQRKKTHSGWLPCGRGRSRFQVTSDGSRLKGPLCQKEFSKFFGSSWYPQGVDSLKSCRDTRENLAEGNKDC